jgi:hypothetical protein
LASEIPIFGIRNPLLWWLIPVVLYGWITIFLKCWLTFGSWGKKEVS